jgi:predicted secreted protein
MRKDHVARGQEPSVFEDKRSKRIVLVAHCILNQNAKIDRCAHYPGAVTEVVNALVESGVGIVQMPCPELLLLGLDRQVDRTLSATIESEDTRVGRLMLEPNAGSLCRELARGLVDQIEEYRKNGFQVHGAIGINGSPTCGVESSWFDDEPVGRPGAFIRALLDECIARELPLPVVGVKAYEPSAALGAVRSLLRP